MAGARPARLVAVDSARVAATVELHESMAGMAGMMTMKPIALVDVPAAGSVRFAPEGRHAMLFGIAPQVKAGDLVPLGFRFSRWPPPGRGGTRSSPPVRPAPAAE